MWKEALHFPTALETRNSSVWKVAVILTIITRGRLLERGQGLLEREGEAYYGERARHIRERGRRILEREGEAY
jgi:hypothetical protein